MIGSPEERAAFLEPESQAAAGTVVSKVAPEGRNP